MERERERRVKQGRESRAREGGAEAWRERERGGE